MKNISSTTFPYSEINVLCGLLSTAYNGLLFENKYIQFISLMTVSS